MVIYLGVLLLGLASALQSSVMPQIRILGGQPDLVFLLVLAWAVNTRLTDGLIWAFVGGIMHNLLSAAPLGVSSLSMILLVFVVDSIRRQVYSIGRPLVVLLVIFGSLFHQLMVMLIISLIGYNIAFLDSLSYVVAPTIAYNLVVIWPVYWFMRRVQRRLTGGRPPLM